MAVGGALAEGGGGGGGREGLELREVAHFYGLEDVQGDRFGLGGGDVHLTTTPARRVDVAVVMAVVVVMVVVVGLVVVVVLAGWGGVGHHLKAKAKAKAKARFGEILTRGG